MKKLILILILSGILVFGYYIMIFEPNNIKIEKETIIIKNLPGDQDTDNSGLPKLLNKIKIVQLSDFHSWWFGPREKKVLKILKELNPDFVFITGDFVDPITKAISDRELNSVKIFWQKLVQQHKNQVFAVLGNHDTKKVKNYLKDAGIQVLSNENKKIFLDDDYFYLIGVNDPTTHQDNLEKAVKEIKKGVLKILLSHGPEIIDEAVKEKIDLVLAGDTHGGQFNFPILRNLIHPLSKYGEKYKSGLFEINTTFLYVNRGIGTSFFPIRFNCPPEITFIELYSTPRLIK